MKKTLTPVIGTILLLTLSVNSIAQSKTTPKSKPAATQKTTKPVAKKPVAAEVKPEQEGEMVDSAVSVTPALPPLPDIDTTAAPNDELTTAIKKLIEVTNGMNTSKTLMKGSLESQRKLNTNVPDEFYDRMLAAVESGQVNGYIENIVVKIYRQKFTLEEVKEVVKFYDSPVGKKMAVESPIIANSARIEGEKVGQYVALKIIADMMKEGKWK